MDNIFNGVENEMPDCKDMSPQSRPDYADRKTPGKEQAGGRSLTRIPSPSAPAQPPRRWRRTGSAGRSFLLLRDGRKLFVSCHFVIIGRYHVPL